MIDKYRQLFNSQFTEKKYQELKNDIASDFGYEPTFRIGETPLFISNELKKQLLEGCADVIKMIQQKDFKKLTNKSLELNHKVPNEDEHTTFLAIDFGICEENGVVIPKLIEVQGFPSLYNYQMNLYEKFKNLYPFLKDLTPFINDITPQEYLETLEEVICNNHPKENVILLEIEPEKQNTKIDFYYCRRDLGIPIVCVTEIIKKGKQLFYKNEKGEEILVKRIYNRVIFDELDLRTDLKLNFHFSDELDVEWAGHPNWFFRISKFILPFLKGKYFIETTLLSDLAAIPEDLENYVLKPLFSFSGSGVIFHVKKEDIEAVTEKELYILQKKVNYIPILQSPDGKVKAEVRVLCVWKKDDAAPTLLCNLVRLSRGEMIGVKFNKDKDWVGGTLGLFERCTKYLKKKKTNLMKTKIHFIFIILFYSVTIYSQNSEVIIENIKPTIDENKFPLIKYKKNTIVEDKINTVLQIENLEHLPNVLKKNAFEKVAYGQERANGSVQFYDYKKNITPKNILSLMIIGEATGAYSEVFETYYNFDLRTGKKLNLKDFITENGIKEITKKLNKNVKKTIELFLVSIKKSLATKSKNLSDEDFSNEQIELYSTCIEDIEQNTIEYYDYYFEKDSITFVRGRCSNHAMRAIDDLDKFKIKFSYNEIKKYFTKYGLSLLNGETNVLEIKSPEGKFYKGKINNKYPITLLLLEIYSDNSLNIQYWYDKNRIPIEWNGNFINNHFSLIEYDHYDEEKQKWLIQAKIEANLINDKIIGTWTNVKTNEIFKIELTEY